MTAALNHTIKPMKPMKTIKPMKEVTLMDGRNQKIIRHKVALLNLAGELGRGIGPGNWAGELGNVSKACPVTGLSRDTF